MAMPISSHLHLSPPKPSIWVSPFLSNLSVSSKWWWNDARLLLPLTLRVAREQQQEGAWQEYGDREAMELLKGSSIADDTQYASFLQNPHQEAQLFTALDACLNTTDMKLVDKTYSFLCTKGLLPNFGRYKNVAMDGPRNVTPSVLLKLTGLEASKFSPKKWGVSGRSAVLLVASLVLICVLVNNKIEVRPTLSIILALAVADEILLGGTAKAQVLTIWPAYRRRVMVHESGHILIAYLLGCPVRGVILDAIQAMRMGIQGQAGTQFWDETLMEELEQGRLTNMSLDRYCMILFAGIAAEALVYGEAEGGENDENLYKAIASTIKPPWNPAQMSNQARWALLESYKLLMKHKNSLEAVIECLEKGSSLAKIVRRIEASMLSSPAIS